LAIIADKNKKKGESKFMKSIKNIAIFFALLSFLYASGLWAGLYLKNEGLNDFLQKNNVINAAQPLRLHFGCGETHLRGYVNIDFPPSEHTVQKTSPADLYTDITTIRVNNESVDEIRLHHVFEHFDRSTALALLCKWLLWLKPGGSLIIETPDFYASARIVLSSEYSYEQKQIAMRHIFGSHEAHWAIHCDGWYPEKFNHILFFLGYTDIRIEKGFWNRLIPNVTVKAKKMECVFSARS
jgi:predicted SAM-dependent methyltransferase